MLSSIVLSGAFAKTKGLGALLEERLFEKLPASAEFERVEIVAQPKERGMCTIRPDVCPSGRERGTQAPGHVGVATDPQIMSWRGAAVLSQLEPAQDLWITSAAWVQRRERNLLDKAPYLFAL